MKIFLMIVGLGICNIAVWRSGEASSGKHRLGAFAVASELDAVVAMGCGQNPSTNNNPNCSQLDPGCTKNGQIPDITCASPGAQCGGCSGVKKQTCQGQVNNNGLLCFEQNLNDCCAQTSTCVQLNGTWGSGGPNPQPGTNCSCGNAGQNYPAGGAREFANAPQVWVECGVLE